MEADCTLPQSPLGLRSDLSLNNNSSFVNCSSKQLRYVTLFRGRAGSNLTKWDDDDCDWAFCFFYSFAGSECASAHQYSPAYWAKMKAGQLLNQKVQQRNSEKKKKMTSLISRRGANPNRERREKNVSRPLHSKMYKAAAAAMQDKDENIQDIYKFTEGGGRGDRLDCKETPSRQTVDQALPWAVWASLPGRWVKVITPLAVCQSGWFSSSNGEWQRTECTRVTTESSSNLPRRSRRGLQTFPGC